MTESESLRLAIVEPIRLSPYDPDWVGKFEMERDRLWVLCPDSFRGIEHIGSTAVTGLSAKPVIDLMAGVDSVEQAESLLPLLCENGYTTSPEFNATLRDSRWLMRHAGGHRTHHLHLLVFDSDEWRRRLKFRDVLRQDLELRCRYEKLKLELMSSFGNDREAYTAMKSDFLKEVLQTADERGKSSPGRIQV